MTYWLPVINAIGLLVLLIANTFFQWKRGNSEASSETIGLLQSQINALRQNDEANQKKIGELTKLVENMQKQLNEKDEVLKKYSVMYDGKDGGSLEFQSRALQAFEQIKDVAKITGESYELTMRINDNVEKLYRVIERHLALIEKKFKIKGGDIKS